MFSENKSKKGLWATIAKLGSKALSLLAKIFKLTKVGLLAVSFVGYSILFSWKFALLILISIGWHEQGHVWAMRKMNIKTKGWYAIPFLGGAAIAEEDYRTYGENAYISIMGPVWGMLMAGAAALVYYVTANPLWAAVGAWMCTLNLFNLLPITPLDGGQLMRAIAFSINKNLGVIFLAVSMVFAGIVLWKLHIGLFVLILIVGALELFVEINGRIKLRKYKLGHLSSWELPRSMIKNGMVKEYPNDMNKLQLALTVLSYVGTIAGLLAILFLLKNVPGADLAANFLE